MWHFSGFHREIKLLILNRLCVPLIGQKEDEDAPDRYLTESVYGMNMSISYEYLTIHSIVSEPFPFKAGGLFCFPYKLVFRLFCKFLNY